MYIPNDFELVKLATAIENIEDFLNKMLNDENYTVENDCELALKILFSNDKLHTALKYFNIRKRLQ